MLSRVAIVFLNVSSLSRETARIDGRGNVTRTVYDGLGRVAATIDALSNTTAYDFDEIGNRRTSSECGVMSAEYVANELNQYTIITSQTSQTSQTFQTSYDADGNQTLVKTATGVWSVTYNGENCVVSYLAYAIGGNDLFYLESAAVFDMPCDKAKSTPGLWSVYPNFERRFYYKDWR